MTPTDPPLDPGAAAVIASLLEARTGQTLSSDRSWRIDLALRPLLAEIGAGSIGDLVGRLLEGGDRALSDRIVDALLNQETSFFRDAGVLEGAVRVLGELPGTSPRRIWCAGCATGQEPLSLAMLFAEAGGPMPEIVATDVSAGAIARARSGRYTQFEVQRGLPIRRLVRWFEGGQADASWVASPALLEAVRYRRHHLAADPPPSGGFDLVLCRNLLFYLSPAARARAIDELSDAVRPGGLLLLGAGETVADPAARFTFADGERGLYRRWPERAAHVA